MIHHWLPASARSSGIPREGAQASLGTVKLPSIHRDAVIWKTEGVGPNSLSDCGFRVIWVRSCHRLCGHRHFSAIGAPSESPSREVTDEEYGPEAAVWMSHDHRWQSSNEAEVGMGAGWLMSWH